ncbi:hypothetical protein AQJ23_10815 [Streptomyces antibioticus]|nr:DUF4232 domain-containing protein [Streptomyces antibioticus]KUN28359.1 hypothetical protein AQJ23_10815 [Streptomyces antibioticus]
MPAVIRVLPALAGAVLFLAACGSENASTGAERAEGAPESSAGAESSCRSFPVPSADGPGEDGVRITGLYGRKVGNECADYSAAFELTNQGTSRTTYTVTFGFLSASGGSVDNVERTVEAVAPGRTVKGTVVRAQSVGSAPEVTGVKVVKMRSVPTAEASSASGPCPASGVHVYADEGDAAMGLRVVGLHLVNCGTAPYRLNGYPGLELLDEDHEKVDGVRILHGTDAISTGAGGGGSPRPVVLKPGEAARTTLAWRNTTQAGDAVNAPYVRVRPKPGAAPVMVIPELDLGTTGKLGVGPWEPDEPSSR